MQIDIMLTCIVDLPRYNSLLCTITHEQTHDSLIKTGVTHSQLNLIQSNKLTKHNPLKLFTPTCSNVSMGI